MATLDIAPPTDIQVRMARNILNPLTDTQRRAVIAVVAYETVQEMSDHGVEE